MNRTRDISFAVAHRYCVRYKGYIQAYNVHYSILMNKHGQKICFIKHHKPVLQLGTRGLI